MKVANKDVKGEHSETVHAVGAALMFATARVGLIVCLSTHFVNLMVRASVDDALFVANETTACNAFATPRTSV